MGLQTPLPNQINGTILPAGTLSSEFDLQGYALFGIIATSNSVNGTLGFFVSDKADAQGGVYRTLYNNAGAAIAITAPSGQWGISSDYLTPIKGYRYVRVSSTAQTTGLAFTLILKAE